MAGLGLLVAAKAALRPLVVKMAKVKCEGCARLLPETARGEDVGRRYVRQLELGDGSIRPGPLLEPRRRHLRVVNGSASGHW